MNIDTSTSVDPIDFIRDAEKTFKDAATDCFDLPHPYNFTANQKSYKFSTEFEFDSDSQEACVKVIKNSFHFRNHYELYSLKGYEGKGISRAFSLGSLYTWAKEIDIYDAQGNSIGIISGKFFTSAAAKYNLYNAKGNLEGIAFVDKGARGVSIIDPKNQIHNHVAMRRHDSANEWTARVHDSTAIDPRILQIFTAFIIDSQDQFKKEN